MKLPLLLFLPLVIALSACSATPSHKNVRYDQEFSRSKMDLWLPKSKEPTPVIVFFHGGGFRSGDKSKISLKEGFMGFPDKGVAIVSVGYPLVGDKGKTTEIGQDSREDIYAHTAKAIRFLKQHAETYNLDTERIAVAGSSAGAKIAGYLTYREELGISICVALDQPLRPEKTIQFIQKGDPPIILYSRSDPSDHIHSPAYSKQIHEHCQRIGVKSYLFGNKKSGLPQVPRETNFIEHASKILFQAWNMP